MAQPTLQVNMAISPSFFAQGDETCTLTITATLEYDHPITIYTWFSMFNLYRAQRRLSNFTCIDLSDNDRRIDMAIDMIQRTPCVSLEIGGQDDEFLVTFYPGVPVTFTNKLDLATRYFCDTLEPGHRYRFSINPGRNTNGARFFQWGHGTREDIMTKEFKWAREELQRSEILIKGGEDVEFEVDGDAAPPKLTPGGGRWTRP